MTEQMKRHLKFWEAVIYGAMGIIAAFVYPYIPLLVVGSIVFGGPVLLFFWIFTYFIKLMEEAESEGIALVTNVAGLGAVVFGLLTFIVWAIPIMIDNHTGWGQELGSILLDLAETIKWY